MYKLNWFAFPPSEETNRARQGSVRKWVLILVLIFHFARNNRLKHVKAHDRCGKQVYKNVLVLADKTDQS